jgi:hypothetical protein
MTAQDNWFSPIRHSWILSLSAIVVVLLDGLDASFSVDPMISVMAISARGRRRPMLGTFPVRPSVLQENICAGGQA